MGTVVWHGIFWISGIGSLASAGSLVGMIVGGVEEAEVKVHNS